MDIETLSINFSATKKIYVRLKKSIEGAVVREEWSSGLVHSLEPLEIERLGELPGSLLKKEPARTNGKTAYGMDAKNRVMSRSFGTPRVGQFYEEFFKYEDGGIWSAYFGPTKLKELINVKFRKIDDGKVVSVLAVGKRGNRTLQFNYTGARVVSIDVSEFRDLAMTDTNNFRSTVSYGSEGNVVKIVNVFPNGHVEQRFPLAQ